LNQVIKLLLHTVLVLPSKVEEADELIKRAKAAGIHIELDKREQAAVELGTVISIGPTCFKDYGRDASILSEGDLVSFAKYAGKTIEHKGIKYLILNDVDILAVITEEDA